MAEQYFLLDDPYPFSSLGFEYKKKGLKGHYVVLEKELKLWMFVFTVLMRLKKYKLRYFCITE